MMSKMERRGLSELYGSWKMIWIFLRHGRNFAGERREMTVSSYAIVPAKTLPERPGGTTIPPMPPGSLLRGLSALATTQTNFWRTLKMADIFQLRTTMRAASATLAAAQAQLDVFIQELDDAQGEVPPPLLAFLRRQVMTQQQVVRKDTTAFDNAQAAYQAAVTADPMNSTDAGLPLALLPVRIETAYLPSTSVAGGTDLVVRVYPDDIHVDTHEPELTSAELAAGTAYWRASPRSSARCCSSCTGTAT